MSLQVRVRHALGERLVDLADRPVEQPLVVGRAREADVKIPSVAVATEHCALFVHEGQWVLQDTSGGSTFVNGHAIQGPTALCIGDTITLGSDSNPATIEVDPAAAAQGRGGEPAQIRADASARPPTMGAAQPQGGQGEPYLGPPPASAAPPPLLMAQSSAQWGDAAGSGDDPFAAWSGADGASVAGASGGVRRQKPARQSTEGGLILGIGICVLIVVGTAWFAYHQYQLRQVVPPPPPPLARQEAPVKQYDNIFGVGTPVKTAAPPRQPPLSRQPSDSSDAPSPTPDPTSPTPTDPEPVTDKDWQEVEGASISNEVGQSILKFDDYKSRHPNEHTKDLNAYVEQAADRLWWKRISQLCAKRDRLTKEVRQKEKEIKDEPSASFKKTLTEEKKKLDDDLGRTQERLTTEMGYTSETTPDPDNPGTMEKLTAERDAAKFATWKLRTLRYIRSNRGSTPWDGES